jgi:hypothetical protein
MQVKACVWCGGGRGRAALRVGALALPALFWASVFASLAGGRALERLWLLADWGWLIADSW